MRYIWDLLPLLAIPLAIYFYWKYSKLDSFLQQLFREGRISARERFSQKSDMTQPGSVYPPPNVNIPPNNIYGVPPVQPGQPYIPGQQTPPMQPVQPFTQGQQTPPVQSAQPFAQRQQTPPVQPAQPFIQGQQTPPVQPAQPFVQGQQTPPVQPAQPFAQGQQTPPVQPAWERQGAQSAYAPFPNTGNSAPPYIKPPKPSKPINSSAVMLTVGVVLVSIAGLIFATAVWSSMSGGGRTLTVAAASLFFFAISAFALKKLKLSDSSNAFYSLGSVFAAITYATAGYYELMGDSLTFEGDHSGLFYSLGAGIIALLAFAALKIYKRIYLGVIAISGAAVSYALLSYDIADNKYSVFALMLAVLFSACLVIVTRLKGKPVWAADNLRVIAGLAFIVSIPSVLIVHRSEWETADFFTAVIYLAIISYYAFRAKSKPMLYAHSVYVILAGSSVVSQFSNGSSGGSGSGYAPAAVFLVMFALALVYRFVGRLRTPISDNAFTAILLISSLTSAARLEDTVAGTLLFLLLMGYMAILAYDDRPYSMGYGIVLPIPVILSMVSLGAFIESRYDVNAFKYVVLLLCVILAAAVDCLMHFREKLKRSTTHIRLSFIIAACLSSGLVSLGGDKLLSMDLFALIALIGVFLSAIYCKTAVISFIPVLRGSVLMCDIIARLIDSDNGAGELIASLITFAVFALLSRLIFRKSVLQDIGRGTVAFDTLALGAGAACLMLLIGAAKHGSSELFSLMMLAFCAEAWALASLLIRPDNDKSLNTAFSVLSLLPALVCAGFLVRYTSTFVQAENGIPVLIASLVSAMVFAALSKLFFTDTLIKRTPRGDVTDSFAAAALGAVFALFLALPEHFNDSTQSLLAFAAWGELWAVLSLGIRAHNPKNTNTLVSAVSCFPAAISIIHLVKVIASLSDAENGIPELIAACSALAVFIIVSRFLFPASVQKPSEGGMLLDAFAAAAAGAVLAMFSNTLNSQGSDTYYILLLTQWIAAGVLIFTLIRKQSPPMMNTAFGAGLFLPTAGTAFSAMLLISHYLGGDNGAAEITASVIILAICLTLSRLRFGSSLVSETTYGKFFDIFTVGAGLMPVMLLYYSADLSSEYSRTLLLAACLEAAVFIRSLIRVKNPGSLNTAFGLGLIPPVLGTSVSALSLVSHHLGQESGAAEIIASFAIMALFILGSRLVFRSSLTIKGDLGSFFDVFTAGAGVMPLMMFMYAGSNVTDNNKLLTFIGWLEAGIFLLTLIRRSNDERLNTAFHLISAFAFMAAFIARPFLVADEQTVEFKITLTAITVFGFAAKYILRKNQGVADNFAMVVHILALILLIGDALTNLSLMNTFFVLTVAVIIMIVSFIVKRKRWFLISSVTIVGLTVYICRDFLLEISWWVYLLAVGLILITIAVSNEYMKNKRDSRNAPQKGRFFEEWKW